MYECTLYFRSILKWNLKWKLKNGPLSLNPITPMPMACFFYLHSTTHWTYTTYSAIWEVGWKGEPTIEKKTWIPGEEGFCIGIHMYCTNEDTTMGHSFSYSYYKYNCTWAHLLKINRGYGEMASFLWHGSVQDNPATRAFSFRRKVFFPHNLSNWSERRTWTISMVRQKGLEGIHIQFHSLVVYVLVTSSIQVKEEEKKNSWIVQTRPGVDLGLCSVSNSEEGWLVSKDKYWFYGTSLHSSKPTLLPEKKTSPW